MSYEELLREADKLGIIVKELDLKTRKGRCCGNKIAINKKLSIKEKAGVLAEELGHFHKTVGNISNQKELANRKQEIIARRWGYEKSVGIIGLINAFNNNCRDAYEIADFLGVTKEYLDEAIDYFRCRYGTRYEIDEYIIYFIPNFGIYKSF
ncbi:TPA: hypothetical protein I9Z65_000137 [Clostridium perfringens]|uniref:ImmA/IrrE family metallo-endopeptidase n=1 Tax=Clostridium perfringens TaxID=1502 RepID=UPI001B81D72D|nr:ImmA/IrrE family metallo-endopeptidase [Clostridium perfringens]MDH2475929.1 hypothetical protein [Clostridium perfringens]HBC2028632.1 hypothetical protein [Clostridium perfringens]HBC2031963.1 hypothetical protein [Clostridium perfringens]HBC2055698.1 hypothetical protein [Clostridium perfringens]HBC2069314.1 hypothetical protein [Clostridium perfringens]